MQACFTFFWNGIDKAVPETVFGLHRILQILLGMVALAVMRVIQQGTPVTPEVSLGESYLLCPFFHGVVERTDVGGLDRRSLDLSPHIIS